MTADPTSSWGDTTVHARGRAPTTGRRSRRSRTLAVAAVVTLALLLVAAIREVGTDVGREQVASRSDCRLDHCSGDPGVSGSVVTRDEVAARARQWVGDTDVRYSMTGGHAGPGGWGWYRRDCSGFVSMALHLPDDGGGATTVGLADSVVAIPVDQLRPYDLVGHVGPHSGGENGHVQLFLGWADATHTRVRVVEQGGLRPLSTWPHEATYPWPELMADGTVLRAYRYVHMRG